MNTPSVSCSSPLVFISAKSADLGHARQIHDFLESRGIRVFLSAITLPHLGITDYRKQIDRALDEARHMVVVTSSVENVQSEWVEAEWGFFINEKRSGNKNGNLLTVIVGSMAIRSLPPSLRYYEVIQFAPSNFDRILNYVSTGQHSAAAPGSKSSPLAAKESQAELPAQAVRKQTEGSSNTNDGKAVFLRIRVVKCLASSGQSRSFETSANPERPLHDLLDEIFYSISAQSEPASFGRKWYLHDEQTGRRLLHLETPWSRGETSDTDSFDHRKLAEVGIVPGMKLKVKPLN